MELAEGVWFQRHPLESFQQRSFPGHFRQHLRGLAQTAELSQSPQRVPGTHRTQSPALRRCQASLGFCFDFVVFCFVLRYWEPNPRHRRCQAKPPPSSCTPAPPCTLEVFTTVPYLEFFSFIKLFSKTAKMVQKFGGLFVSILL